MTVIGSMSLKLALKLASSKPANPLMLNMVAVY